MKIVDRTREELRKLEVRQDPGRAKRVLDATLADPETPAGVFASDGKTGEYVTPLSGPFKGRVYRRTRGGLVRVRGARAVIRRDGDQS